MALKILASYVRIGPWLGRSDKNEQGEINFGAGFNAEVSGGDYLSVSATDTFLLAAQQQSFGLPILA